MRTMKKGAEPQVVSNKKAETNWYPVKTYNKETTKTRILIFIYLVVIGSCSAVEIKSCLSRFDTPNVNNIATYHHPSPTLEDRTIQNKLTITL
jgi:hypothetical protein